MDIKVVSPFQKIKADDHMKKKSKQVPRKTVKKAVSHLKEDIKGYKKERSFLKKEIKEDKHLMDLFKRKRKRKK